MNDSSNKKYKMLYRARILPIPLPDPLLVFVESKYVHSTIFKGLIYPCVN